MNSFRAVHRALEFEIERQTGVLDAGGTLVQETRGWVEAQGRTIVAAKQGAGTRLPLFPRARSAAAAPRTPRSSSGCARPCLSFPRPERIASRSSSD